MSLTRNDLKDIKSLLTGKGRKQHKRFSAEGIRVLEEALRFGFKPRLLCYSSDDLTERGRTLLGRFEAEKIPAEAVKTSQLSTIGEAKTHQGMIGVFECKYDSIAQLIEGSSRKILLCDGISDPGNLGTLIRSALAFGFESVLLCGSSADPYSPKVVRSTAGSIFGVKLARAEYSEIVRFVEEYSVMMIGAVAVGKNAKNDSSAFSVRDRFVLAIGSEADGLSREVENLCKVKMRIDHTSFVDSLNAAVAGSILMKQLFDLAQEAET